jgi:hypothetical protein
MSLEDERAAIQGQLHYLGAEVGRHDTALEQIEERMEAVKNELLHAIEKAYSGTLSEDERMWVKLTIKREGQRIEVRQAVIEKTLSGLVWLAIIGIGIAVLDYVKDHMR